MGPFFEQFFQAPIWSRFSSKGLPARRQLQCSTALSHGAGEEVLLNQTLRKLDTFLGTNISHTVWHFWVDDFPNFPRWDMLVPWRVAHNFKPNSSKRYVQQTLWHNDGPQKELFLRFQNPPAITWSSQDSSLLKEQEKTRKDCRCFVYIFHTSPFTQTTAPCCLLDRARQLQSVEGLKERQLSKSELQKKESLFQPPGPKW